MNRRGSYTTVLCTVAPHASMGFTNYSLLLQSLLSPSWDVGPGYLCTIILHIKRKGVNKKYPSSSCIIWRLVTLCQPLQIRLSWVNVWISREHVCTCIYIGIISAWVYLFFLMFFLCSSSQMRWAPVRSDSPGRENEVGQIPNMTDYCPHHLPCSYLQQYQASSLIPVDQCVWGL